MFKPAFFFFSQTVNKVIVEEKIPDINRQIDKWESDEDNDEDTPKFLNQRTFDKGYN